jgi:hypothetical protein
MTGGGDGGSDRHSFAQQLSEESEEIRASYLDIVGRSAIRNVDPNRGGGRGAVFIGSAKWGWQLDETGCPCEPPD